MMDSVQIRCTRCKGVFRDRARRLQNGFSRQCPTCEVVLFFDEDSNDSNIKRAMKAARRPHGALDIGVVGILVEKQHDLAGRALSGKAVLQSPGAVAKYALAPGAADLNGVHHMGAVA